MNDPAKTVELQDALEHLAARGFSRLLKALSDERVYTHDGGGRLILAAIARRLKVTPRRAAAMLQEAKLALM